MPAHVRVHMLAHIHVRAAPHAHAHTQSKEAMNRVNKPKPHLVDKEGVSASASASSFGAPFVRSSVQSFLGAQSFHEQFVQLYHLIQHA